MLRSGNRILTAESPNEISVQPLHACGHGVILELRVAYTRWKAYRTRVRSSFPALHTYLCCLMCMLFTQRMQTDPIFPPYVVFSY